MTARIYRRPEHSGKKLKQIPHPHSRDNLLRPLTAGKRGTGFGMTRTRTLWEHGAELAGREIFQGGEAGVEFGRGQAALAVERAQKIRSRTVALERVAFEAAGNQVAVGIASEARARDNVVEALHMGGSAAEAVKAGAAFAIVNGFAERPSTQEIRGFESRGRRLSRVAGSTIFARAECADLLGQAHLDEVAGFAAFEQA